MSNKLTGLSLEASPLAPSTEAPGAFRSRSALFFSVVFIALGIAEIVIGFIIFFYSVPRFGGWWAGLVSMLLGLGGLRVNTRCRGYAFALCSIVVAVVYFVAMLIDGVGHGMMLSFEACREPLTADELDDCGVVLDSCTIPDLYEASAALCATSYEVDCACVNEELECFEFEDVHSCPGLLDTYSSLLFDSFMICLFGMIAGLFASTMAFVRLCCCQAAKW